MEKLIVTGGNLAWEGTPGRGGHIMFILQWLEGLRRLGHEVLYYDKAYGERNVARLFADIMEQWWSPSLSALVLPTGGASYGLNGKEVEHFGRDVQRLFRLVVLSNRNQNRGWQIFVRAYWSSKILDLVTCGLAKETLMTPLGAIIFTSPSDLA